MAMETQTDPRKNFVPRLLAVAAGGGDAAGLLADAEPLGIACSIINSVAKISGWTWQPEVLGPVTFLVTYPLRWLPATAIPLALNLFSAVCAALALGLLARSVALLPHDRTDAQRQREGSAFSLSDDPQRVAAAAAGRGGLRPATHVLGARDQLDGRDARPAAVRRRDLVAAGIPAGRARRAAVCWPPSFSPRAWRTIGGWWAFCRCLCWRSCGCAASVFSICAFWGG